MCSLVRQLCRAVLSFTFLKALCDGVFIECLILSELWCILCGQAAWILPALSEAGTSQAVRNAILPWAQTIGLGLTLKGTQVSSAALDSRSVIANLITSAALQEHSVVFSANAHTINTDFTVAHGSKKACMIFMLM